MALAAMTGVSSATFLVRLADRSDLDAVAAAHVDSIRSIGAQYYSAAVVDAWGARIAADLYVKAMARGERFFVAVDHRGGVLGFSSHRVDAGVHGVAVYVRGDAARQGVGSALLRVAEVAAVAAGATEVRIDASLAALDFYKTHRFEEVGRGAHRLPSGETMACVFMRKDLS
jgi:putative acetyltransferase